MNSEINAEWDWPLPHPAGDQELKYLRIALAESDWSHTSFCERFEREFASFLGVRHALMVPSGTAAVYLALVAAGIQQGQEVIIPGITWPSVVYAILQAGGVPRTVDISLETLCMTSQTIEAAVNERTFAVLATHIFGSQCDMQTICEMAKRRQILVIEDAAQSVGSVQGDKKCGTWGVAGAFSLNDRKLLACGEGGCVVTDSDAIYEELRRLQLILPERATVPSSVPGTYKVSEFQGAVALAQLEQLPAKLQRMESASYLLTSKIAPASPRLSRQAQPASVTLQSYFNYCINLRGIDTEAFAAELSRETGLRVARPYTPISDVSDLQPLLRDDRLEAGELLGRRPNCDAAFEYGSLRLPHLVLMSELPIVERLGAKLLTMVEAAG